MLLQMCEFIQPGREVLILWSLESQNVPIAHLSYDHDVITAGTGSEGRVGAWVTLSEGNSLSQQSRGCSGTG